MFSPETKASYISKSLNPKTITNGTIFYGPCFMALTLSDPYFLDERFVIDAHKSFSNGIAGNTIVDLDYYDLNREDSPWLLFSSQEDCDSYYYSQYGDLMACRTIDPK